MADSLYVVTYAAPDDSNLYGVALFHNRSEAETALEAMEVSKMARLTSCGRVSTSGWARMSSPLSWQGRGKTSPGLFRAVNSPKCVEYEFSEVHMQDPA
jgi:hypothetical protein